MQQITQIKMCALFHHLVSTKEEMLGLYKIDIIYNILVSAAGKDTQKQGKILDSVRRKH
jgi:hypothetical protein